MRAAGILGVLRRGLGAQHAYVAGIERLTADYVRAMVAAARGRAPTTDAAVLSPAPAPAAAPDPAILLEAETGAVAAGRFLVENHLDQPISAPVHVSAFTSAQGDTVDVRLRFEPDVVTLQPREQLLVRVGTRIDEQLTDAGGYWGRLAVRELPGTELVVLVRRRAASRPETAPTLMSMSTSKPFSKGSP